MDVIRSSVLNQVALCAKVQELELLEGDEQRRKQEWRKEWWKDRHRKRLERAKDNYKEVMTQMPILQNEKNNETVKQTNTHNVSTTEGDNTLEVQEIVIESDDEEKNWAKRKPSSVQVEFSFPAVLPENGYTLNLPNSREGGTLTACEDLLIAFGGRCYRQEGVNIPRTVQKSSNTQTYYYSNHVYVFNTKRFTWTMPRCTGKWPIGRMDHSAVYVEPHFLVVFGGRGESGAIFNDICCLSLVMWEWTFVLQLENSPSRRYWHAAVAHSSSVYVFGGKDGASVFGDLWEFDVLAYEKGNAKKSNAIAGAQLWTIVETLGQPPSSRFGSSMLQLDSDKVIVTGGWQIQKVYSTQVTQFLDVFVLDTVTMVWSTPRIASHFTSDFLPTQRLLASCFIFSGHLVVFGGYAYQVDVPGVTITDSRYAMKENCIYTLELDKKVWRRQYIGEGAPFCHYGMTSTHVGDDFYFFENVLDAEMDRLVKAHCKSTFVEYKIA